MTATSDDLDDVEQPAPRPKGLFGSLTFRPPNPSTEQEETGEGSSLDDLGEDSPSGSGSPLDELPDPLDDDPISSTELPAGDPAGLPVVGKRALSKTFRKGVLITSATAHRFAARTHGQRAAGLYLADEEDATNIGDPLAAIMARRGGTAGKLSPDANDALQALMGLGGYIAKQVAAAQEAAALDQRIASGELHVVTEAADL